MKGKFVSLRVKIMLAFTAMVVVIAVVVAVLLPRYINNHYLEVKKEELMEVQKTIGDITAHRDILRDETSKRILDSVARSSDVSIWICLPENGSFRIISYGGKETAQGLGAERSLRLTAEQFSLLEKVYNGAEAGFYTDLFDNVFNEKVISYAYRQELFLSDNADMSVIDPIGEKAEGQLSNTSTAVLLHLAMSDITNVTKPVIGVTVIISFIIALMSWFVMFFVTGNIIYPVKRLQQAADAISQGDFSQVVVNTQNDEIGQLTDSFNRMSQELKELDTLQSDFITNISHDFRSPLTSIKGYVEAMLDGTIPPDKQEKYLNIVLDETNRLAKMTNNVLDLTRMENGQIEIIPTDFDINEVILRLSLGLEQRVEDKNIEMHFDFASEHMFVNADEELIERVIYNLLDNALKFTPKGGSITVESCVLGKKASISVLDTGEGISEESLPHIFERFHKGDKSRGRDKLGTGLGLTIAKQIMITHHEDLKVESREGQGSCFSFTLPLSQRVRE